MTGAPRVAVVGMGYWGPNVAATAARLPGLTLAAVVDADSDRREWAAQRHPGVPVHASLDEAIETCDLDWVYVAVPASLHAAVLRTSLEAGLPALVAKPLDVDLESAEAIVSAFAAKDVLLGVEHTVVYQPAVEVLCQEARLRGHGRALHASTVRANLGRYLVDAGVVWDLVSHDVALLGHILGEWPVEAVGASRHFRGGGMSDVFAGTLFYESGCMATVQATWLSPVKERRLRVCYPGMLGEIDELAVTSPVAITEFAGAAALDVADLTPSFRLGATTLPVVEPRLPLDVSLEAFADAVAGGEPYPTDGAFGLEVVRTLTALDAATVWGPTPG